MSVSLDRCLYNMHDLSDEQLASEINSFQDISIMMDHPYVRAMNPYDFPITKERINEICSIDVLTDSFIATSVHYPESKGWRYFGNRHHCGKWLLCVWLPSNKCDELLSKNFSIWREEPIRWKRYYCIHEFGKEFYVFPKSESLKKLMGEFPYREFDLDILKKFYRVVPRSIIGDKLSEAFQNGTKGIKSIFLSRGDATDKEIEIGLKAASSVKADIRVKLDFNMLKGMSVMQRLSILELVSEYNQSHASKILNLSIDDVDSLLATSAMRKPERVKDLYNKLKSIIGE